MKILLWILFLGSTNLHDSQTTFFDIIPLWRSTNLHDSQTKEDGHKKWIHFLGTTNLHGSQTYRMGLRDGLILLGSTILHDSQTLKYCCKPFGYYKFT